MPLNVDIKMDPKVSLNLKRTLSGDVMIFDHEDIDILLMLEKRKILTLPKSEMSDGVYAAQDRMFNFLIKRGVVEPSSVRGSNIYGSIEASMLESKIKGIDSNQATLYSIFEYIKEERPFFRDSKQYNQDTLDSMLRPDPDDSTELGEIPHSDKKGSADPRVRPYGYMYNYSLIREEDQKEID